MLHKEIPFLRIGLPLCAGIVADLYIKPDDFPLVLIIIIVISGFFFSYFLDKYQTNLIYGFSLTISLFTCGYLLYANEKNSISHLNPEKTLFTCTLSDYPEKKEKTFRLTVKLNNKITPGGPESVNGSMIIYCKRDTVEALLLPGDQMIIKCLPQEIVNRGNPYEFDYRFYMQNQGIRYYAFISNNDIICHTTPLHRNLTYRALIIREKIIDMYEQRGITGERLALVAAITLGQKNMLDPEQKQNFIKAGVMHIMAVSGLHAVILSLFVFSMLFFLKRRFNVLRIIITILILWAFAFVTGLTPSVLRATLMFSFLQAGNLMKRRVNGINSVLASAFVLILLRPSVIFDAGFLLSYSAVIYIICFYRDLYCKLHFKSWLPDIIWQSAAVTIIAQAGTLPLTIHLFNRFPTYFIITNIIIVPLSSVLVIIGCIIPMLYPVKLLSGWLGILLSYLTGVTESLTAKTASLPLSTIENIGLATSECILLTGTIFLFTFSILKKRSFSMIYPFSLLVLFAIADTTFEISARKTNELIVYNTPGNSTIGIRTGKILNLYSDTIQVRAEVLKHCATCGLKLKMNPIKNKSYCLISGEKRIMISASPDKYIAKNFKPDIVILTGLKPEIKDLPVNLSYYAFIFTSGKISGYRQQMYPVGIDTIHYVSTSGTFKTRI